MSTPRWERTEQILEEALRLAPEQRKAYLDVVCSTDSDIRRSGISAPKMQ